MEANNLQMILEKARYVPAFSSLAAHWQTASISITLTSDILNSLLPLLRAAWKR
jgi:hypothetical protein